jgi:hypothetical protein
MEIFNKIINFFKNIFGQDIKVSTTKKVKNIVEKNKNCTISIVNGDNNEKRD